MSKTWLMQADPVRIRMRLRFRATADLDICHKIIWAGYHRDRVAQVAFQADGFLVGIHVFAIMAAEAARRVLMSDVIGMRSPV